MTNDLDRALIALRVSRDHGHGAVLNDAEVLALIAGLLGSGSASDDPAQRVEKPAQVAPKEK